MTDSPSVNSPSRYLEGLIGERDANNPVTVACSPAIVILLGDNKPVTCSVATFVGVVLVVILVGDNELVSCFIATFFGGVLGSSNCKGGLLAILSLSHTVGCSPVWRSRSPVSLFSLSAINRKIERVKMWLIVMNWCIMSASTKTLFYTTCITWWFGGSNSPLPCCTAYHNVRAPPSSRVVLEPLPLRPPEPLTTSEFMVIIGVYTSDLCLHHW